jgi:hypothetical protein
MFYENTCGHCKNADHQGSCLLSFQMAEPGGGWSFQKRVWKLAGSVCCEQKEQLGVGVRVADRGQTQGGHTKGQSPGMQKLDSFPNKGSAFCHPNPLKINPLQFNRCL